MEAKPNPTATSDAVYRASLDGENFAAFSETSSILSVSLSDCKRVLIQKENDCELRLERTGKADLCTRRPFERLVLPRGGVFERFEMGRDHRIGNRRTDFAFDPIQKLVPALNRPVSRRQDMHCNEFASPGLPAAQGVELNPFGFMGFKNGFYRGQIRRVERRIHQPGD